MVGNLFNSIFHLTVYATCVHLILPIYQLKLIFFPLTCSLLALQFFVLLVFVSSSLLVKVFRGVTGHRV